MTLRGVSCLIVMLFLTVPLISFSQEVGFGIAQTHFISNEEVVSGDVISYRGTAGFFHLTNIAADERIFGIAVENPTLVLETDPEKTPIVSRGEALVNVTTLSGSIAVGDFVTSSPIPGKAKRATDEDIHIIGVALESFDEDTSTTTLSYEDQTVTTGSISVLLDIGPRQDAFSNSNQTEEGTGTSEENTGAIGLAALRHIVAAFIALGSIFFAFHNFGQSISNGVLSVGRNPKAKRSIQTMIVLDIILILSISGAGLFVSFLIIMIPL